MVALRRADAVFAVFRGYLQCLAAEADVVFSYRLRKTSDERSEAALCGERLFGRLAVALRFRLFQLMDCAADEASVIRFEIVQLGERIAWNDRVRVPGVDAGDERIHRVVENGLPEAAPDETGEVLLGVRAAGAERLERHSELVLEREKRRGEPADDPRGERVELAFLPDVPVAGEARGDFEDVLRAEVFHEFRDFGFPDDARVRTRFPDETVPGNGTDDAARPVFLFENGECGVVLLEVKSCGEAGDSGA